MMITPDKSLAMLYFENRCEIPKISKLLTDEQYVLHWFDPVTGYWVKDPQSVKTGEQGFLKLDAFPDGAKVSEKDWALKLKIARKG